MISNTWNCVLEVWEGKEEGGHLEARWRVSSGLLHHVGPTKPLVWRSPQTQSVRPPHNPKHLLNCCVLPAFASNKSFDVKVYWNVFGGDDGDFDTA